MNHSNTVRSRSFRDWNTIDGRPRGDIKREPRKIWEPDTQNETYISWQDEPIPGRWYWKKLDELNNGFRTLDWLNQPLTRYLHNSHLIDAVCSQLDLTGLIREKVYHRFMGLNLQKQGRPSELVAFCTCAVTVHEDSVYTQRSYHPSQKDSNKDELFEHVRQSLDLREKDVASEYAKLSQKFNSEDMPDLSYRDHDQPAPEGGIYTVEHTPL